MATLLPHEYSYSGANLNPVIVVGSHAMYYSMVSGGARIGVNPRPKKLARRNSFYRLKLSLKYLTTTKKIPHAKAYNMAQLHNKTRI